VNPGLEKFRKEALEGELGDLLFRRLTEQEHIARERQAEQERIKTENWARQGLCHYCGGKLPFFSMTDKCKSCR